MEKKFRVGQEALCGALVGMVFGMILGKSLDYIANTESNRAKVFEEENKPKVIRTFIKFERDDVYVENINSPGDYVSLKRYLRSFQNKYDRKIEEIRIKKQVGW